ncbi:3-hydroxyacyl-CoA dehydrogenase NAD-binding domain-containing protein [Nocardia inohanensis]|uniref:3-hydroxyacyl-CoA dehydrogenase NAD-binding domain-containing protein n=1 Tax=Nocardia inohanensis TaxID=209246 RepID=UPI00082FFDA0|nr:3-hydroxyacyl-CoA dehydrogenase NAD-binding domain-containing protein [Nocardia inohanensis]
MVFFQDALHSALHSKSALGQHRIVVGALIDAEFGGGPDATWTANLAEAVHAADLVQENGPEQLHVKQRIFGEILRAAPPTIRTGHPASRFSNAARHP